MRKQAVTPAPTTQPVVRKTKKKARQVQGKIDTSERALNALPPVAQPIAPTPAPAPAPKQVPQTEAGKARSAGIQDYILAGKPTPAQFVQVYGAAGPRLTWVQRAALGVDAAHFQEALKSGKCVAPTPKAAPAPKATATK